MLEHKDEQPHDVVVTRVHARVLADQWRAGMSRISKTASKVGISC
jgi:hypothetical protein